MPNGKPSAAKKNTIRANAYESGKTACPKCGVEMYFHGRESEKTFMARINDVDHPIAHTAFMTLRQATVLAEDGKEPVVVCSYCNGRYHSGGDPHGVTLEQWKSGVS